MEDACCEDRTGVTARVLDGRHYASLTSLLVNTTPSQIIPLNPLNVIIIQCDYNTIRT